MRVESQGRSASSHPTSAQKTGSVGPARMGSAEKHDKQAPPMAHAAAAARLGRATQVGSKWRPEQGSRTNCLRP